MTDQITLDFALRDSEGKVGRRSPATSREAARSIFPATGRQRRKVLDCIRDHPGSTDRDIQRLTNMNPNSERPRRGELADDGLIERSGTRECYQDGRHWHEDEWSLTDLAKGFYE